MANLSPSRVQPLSPGEEKASDDPRPRKPAAKPALRTPPASLPTIDDGSDELEKHNLDERA